MTIWGVGCVSEGKVVVCSPWGVWMWVCRGCVRAWSEGMRVCPGYEGVRVWVCEVGTTPP